MDLFQKYLENQCSPEEVDTLFGLLEVEHEQVIGEQLVREPLSYDDGSTGYTDPALKELLENRLKVIFQKLEPQEKKGKVFSLTLRRVAAAVLIILLGAASYFFFFNKNEKPVIADKPVPVQNDIAPGHEGAILTLADGQKIILDSSANGVIARQGNSNVIKEQNGLSYHAQSHTQEVVYNTMTTPNGRQYTLVLADGSKVWLNAGSSITYPVVFTGNERKVSITGEAYFEVAHNVTARGAKQSFIVEKGNMQVTVLGTHFNVNAYEDEGDIKVTLLEGSVNVKSSSPSGNPDSNREGMRPSVTLKPGQQARIAPNHKPEIVNNIDIGEVVAWKDGYFHFESADLKTVLRQFARWYDIEVVYEGPVSGRKFFGIVKRSNTLRQVLEMLRDNNIDYRIEGRKLIVRSG